MTVPCTSCGHAVALPEDVGLSEVVVCEGCGIELEVVSLDPVALMPFEEEEK